jgi:hypothetical protein
MRNRICVFIVFLFFSAAVLAQAKRTLSTQSNCGISLIHQTVSIDDHGHHSISLDQRECSFESPTELNGSRIVKYISSGIDDVQFDKSHDQGYAVGDTADGDKYFLRYQGTAILKDGIPLQLAGKWRFTGGTGKLRGLTGQGTYSAQPTSSGGMVFKLEGSYQVSL